MIRGAPLFVGAYCLLVRAVRSAGTFAVAALSVNYRKVILTALTRLPRVQNAGSMLERCKGMLLGRFEASAHAAPAEHVYARVHIRETARLDAAMGNLRARGLIGRKNCVKPHAIS